MIFKFIICLLLLFQINAKEIEGFFGATYTQFDNISTDYNEYGASARIKYNKYGSGGQGLSLLAFWNGHSIFAGDFMAGYGIKTSGSLKFEAAVYGAYSIIWGPGIALLASTNFDLGKNYFLNIPLIFRYPSYLGVAPMFGYRF